MFSCRMCALATALDFHISCPTFLLRFLLYAAFEAPQGEVSAAERKILVPRQPKAEAYGSFGRDTGD